MKPQAPKIGDVLDNGGLMKRFLCGLQGGMRRARRTNSLVVVSDYTKGVYDDRWEAGVLYYTGMGLTGDQRLESAQNRTLAESATNGVAVHLFEVFDAGRYIYRGEVELVSEPFFETQLDDNGEKRQVCVFPLKPIVSTAELTGLDQVKELESRKARQAERLSDEELSARARVKQGSPGSRSVICEHHARDPWVREYAKRRARGICQLCGLAAPFSDSRGNPYLEVHHIVWLSRGGEDSIENTVALCPNCHRRMHIIDSQVDVEELLEAAQETL